MPNKQYFLVWDGYNMRPAGIVIANDKDHAMEMLKIEKNNLPCNFDNISVIQPKGFFTLKEAEPASENTVEKEVSFLEKLGTL